MLIRCFSLILIWFYAPFCFISPMMPLIIHNHEQPEYNKSRQNNNNTIYMLRHACCRYATLSVLPFHFDGIIATACHNMLRDTRGCLRLRHDYAYFFLRYFFHAAFAAAAILMPRYFISTLSFSRYAARLLYFALSYDEHRDALRICSRRYYYYFSCRLSAPKVFPLCF